MALHKNLPRLVCLIAITLFAVSAAFADSDGYFCSGPGYLAAEFRSFNTPGLSSEHVLKIVRFDEALGPRWSGEVMVEEFQTHTLICSSEMITLEGVADHGRGLVTYKVNFDVKGAPHTVSISANPAYVFVPKDGPANLGNWARKGIIPLQSPPGTHRFQLRSIEEPSRREGRSLYHDKKTTLEEFDGEGHLIRSLLLHSGTSKETID